jgi:hypothetical protein
MLPNYTAAPYVGHFVKQVLAANHGGVVLLSDYAVGVLSMSAAVETFNTSRLGAAYLWTQRARLERKEGEKRRERRRP